MALINHTQKWIYLFEPHTASRCTQRAIRTIKDTAVVGHHHISRTELTNWRRQHIDPKRTAHFIALCNVRNPFDVLITKYLSGSFREGTFRDHFQGMKNNPGMDNPLMGLWKECQNFVYYEDIQEDLNWVFYGQNVTLSRRPQESTEWKRPWQEYYENEDDIVKYLMPKYSAFLDKFGYQIEYQNGHLDLVDIDKKVRAEQCKKLSDF